MASFKDTTGREWRLRITVADLDDLTAAGLDVEAVVSRPALLAELAAAPRKFAAVLWQLIAAQAAAANVAPQDFKAALDGETLFAAAGAIEEAVADFSLPPTLAKTFKAERAGVIDRRVTEAADRMRAKMAGSGGPAGSSADSPDSTPAPSPSGS